MTLLQRSDLISADVNTKINRDDFDRFVKIIFFLFFLIDYNELKYTGRETSSFFFFFDSNEIF